MRMYIYVNKYFRDVYVPKSLEKHLY